MKKYKGELALLFVTFIWGTGYVATTVALEQFGTFQILAARFLLSTLILGTVFHKRILALEKNDIKYQCYVDIYIIFNSDFAFHGIIIFF